MSQQQGTSQLLQMNRLVFNQKAKLIELTNQFRIRDEGGQDVGFIQQEGQTALKKVARFVSSLDQFMTHTLAVYDGTGAKVLEVIRPKKFMKSRLQVNDGSGRPVGSIVQQNVFGKIRFGLEGQGVRYGEIRAENWRAWNFSIVDHTEQERARITKTWEGFAKTLFTTADDYLLELDPSISGDFRLLVLASAAGVDTALKQDSRGFG